MLNAFQSPACRNLLASLSQKIQTIARQSFFVQRASKFFCPEQFLLALLNASSTGKGSLHQISVQLALQSGMPTITPQAIHERLHRTLYGAESFLMRCLAFITQQQILPNKKLSTFNRIIVEDSTQLPLHPSNAEEFPGHGNHLGSTAGCKIDISFDLMTGQTVNQSLHTATTSDQTIGYDLLINIQANDLILRDMGYFCLETFALIEQQNAYWLSRLPQGVHAVSSAGETLEKMLGETTSEVLDIPMEIGKKAQHPARLIAVRCSPQESKKNRRIRRAAFRIRGKTPSKNQMARCDWHIMTTNIEKQKQSSSELYELYRQRWQIELAFRGWKKSHHLKSLHKHRTSPTHLKVLILAAIVLLSLTLQLGRLCQQSMSEKIQARFSMEKMFEYISQVINKIRNLLDITEMRPDERQLCGQKRTRKSLIQQQSIILP